MNYRHLEKAIKILILLISAAALSCCSSIDASAAGIVESSSKSNCSEVHIEYFNEAPGIKVVSNDDSSIDYSNAGEGYVMIIYNGEEKAKVIMSGPDDDYTYSVVNNEWMALPLSQGDGSYRVSLFENIEGTKYAQVLTTEFDVTLDNQFAPFIRPNIFVDYSIAPKSVMKAYELTDGIADNLKKVSVVYDFVTRTLSYDTELAKTVKSGYVPDMDAVLEKEKGICFDYASLMTGMLRASGVPCKLVMGYVGDLYHAWISVWVEGEGWIDNAIYFDGTKWERMDPTLASAERYKLSVAQFVGDGTNYSAKYYY